MGKNCQQDKIILDFHSTQNRVLNRFEEAVLTGKND